jgi:hypothetical protein
MNLNIFETANLVQDINPEAMATDTVAPPPAGRYQITLTLAKKIKFNERHPDLAGQPAFTFQDGAGNLVQSEEHGCITYFYLQSDPNHQNKIFQVVLQPVLKITNPDGTVREYEFNREYVSTMVMQGTKTSMADTILRAATGKAGVGDNDGKKIAKVFALGQNNRPVFVDTDWEARYRDSIVDKDGDKAWPLGKFDKRYLSTMANFPKDPRGQAIPLEVDEGGNQISTRLIIKKWLPLQIPTAA